MISWTQFRNSDGEVETRGSLKLGFFVWSAAWVAATGSFGSFLVNLTRAFGWWHSQMPIKPASLDHSSVQEWRP
jgi:hypothetical protein